MEAHLGEVTVYSYTHRDDDDETGASVFCQRTIWLNAGDE